MGAILLCPVAGIALVASPPAQAPSLVAIAAALALALGGTSLAYICYYWLLERVGAANTLIVTYLLPCMALVYGALWLRESISPNAIGGLALVLLGIFFAGRQSSRKHEQVEKVEESNQPVRTPTPHSLARTAATSLWDLHLLTFIASEPSERFNGPLFRFRFGLTESFFAGHSDRVDGGKMG
jgi:hypothetical protein